MPLRQSRLQFGDIFRSDKKPSAVQLTRPVRSKIGAGRIATISKASAVLKAVQALAPANHRPAMPEPRSSNPI